MKTCTKCGNNKPFDEFYKNSRMRDGRYNECKLCIKSKNKQHYINNTERYSERSATWRSRNKEKIAAAEQRRKKDNPEKVAKQRRDAAARYRKNHPDIVKDYRRRTVKERAAYNHRWRQENVLKERQQQHRKRAKKSFSVPQRWIKCDEIEGKCYWCGSDISSYYEIDHIMPISLGGPACDYNEVKTCRKCNGTQGKWDKHPLVWIALQFD